MYSSLFLYSIGQLLALPNWFAGPSYLIAFGILWAVIGARHPPVLDEVSGLGFGRILVAGIGLLIFVLCFIPGSLQIS